MQLQDTGLESRIKGRRQKNVHDQGQLRNESRGARWLPSSTGAVYSSPRLGMLLAQVSAIDERSGIDIIDGVVSGVTVHCIASNRWTRRHAAEDSFTRECPNSPHHVGSAPAACRLPLGSHP